MLKATDDYRNLSIKESLKILQVDRGKGLFEDEAKKRLAEYGYNEIHEKEESLFHRVFRRFWGPIPWMIEIAALLSALVQKWDDFIIITILLFANIFIDFWQESKALNVLRVLKEKLAKKALVFREGKFQTVDARTLVPGDIIKIKIGDLVSADVKLIEGDFIQADQSALTGESLPVSKTVGEIAYSNSIVKQGEMLAVVVNTALNTFFGKTVELVEKAEKEKRSHFQKAVVHIGNYLIILTIFLAAIILITALFRHENMTEILRFTLVLTISTVLGITGVISTFGIFYIAEVYMRLSSAVVQSFIFLKLIVAGHLTIYITRTEKHFWQKPYPSPLLFSATSVTEIIGTLFAVYGVFLTPIGWEYALIVWGYALAWFVVNDFVKISVYKFLRKDKIVM